MAAASDDCRVRKSYILVFLVVLSILLGLFTLRVVYLKRERHRLIFEDIEGNETESIGYINSFHPSNGMDFSKILNIRRKVELMNANPKVQNEFQFGLVEPKTPIIVINVENKVAQLKVMLESLKQVTGIDTILLIFAHDDFSEDINYVIGGIYFTRYVQIFYPYSSQLYPRIFPGKDSKICTSDSLHCVETKGSTIGRNHTLTQIKHSWWWKMNEIFENLKVTKSYDGFIIFLDGNHYVTQDFFYVTNLLIKLMPEFCPHCNMINIGAYAHGITNKIHNQLITQEFGFAKYNMGLVYNRTFWNNVKKFGDHFCDYNDYDWVHSLWYLSTQTPQKRFLMFTPLGSRVLRVGECRDESVEGCVKEKVSEIQNFLEPARSKMFPQNILLSLGILMKNPSLQGQGGWEDARDIELCKFMASKKMWRFHV